MPIDAMLRVRAALRLLLMTVAFALASAVRTGMAAPSAADGGAACGEIEQRVSEAQRELESCSSQRQAAVAEHASCEERFAAATQKLANTQGHADACDASRNSLCKEAAEFVAQVLDGRVTNVGSCVPGSDQARLRELLTGWRNEADALRQLAAYGAGDVDTLPVVRGSSASERILARLLGQNRREPLFYRRLLTQAFAITAPRAWDQIHSGGPSKVDGWFDSSEPLDPKLVQEAQRHLAPSPAVSPGPSLSTALRLAQTYEFVVRCDEEAPSGPCRRAHQLQQLLESTGPLLLRQRMDDIWAADCQSISATTIVSWVQDVPAPVAAPATDFSDVVTAAQRKLFTCFLMPTAGDAEPSFRAWLDRRLPSPRQLDSRMLLRVDEIRSGVRDDTPLDICARAARAMQHVTPPTSCETLPAEIDAPVARWAKLAPSIDEADPAVGACRRYVQLLWEGHTPAIPSYFSQPPTVNTMVRVDKLAQDTPLSRLRGACEHRRGDPEDFAQDLRSLSALARSFGEAPEGPPWRADPATGQPIEALWFASSSTFKGWVEHVVSASSSCRVLGIADARCQECQSMSGALSYDCTLQKGLEARWRRHERTLEGSLGGLAAAMGLVLWGQRMRRARQTFAVWSKDTLARFSALGLTGRPDPLRFVLPSRNDVLVIDLPHEGPWERWGRQACVVRVQDAGKVHEHDVQGAVAMCQRVGAHVVFLLHDDTASLHFGAVRAILDWAARTGTRAIHVLPLAASRLAWARASIDLLDLVEETSMRGNPFEVRGRISTSSHFWDREQLVSGLLAETRAGHWTVVTGLRRFGKSSLALEVTRRLPGPSAYLDLAGFYEEISLRPDPGSAVDTVLRSLCARLFDSARALYPRASLPQAPTGVIDAAALTGWVRSFSSACAQFTDGRPPPMLLVFDELEQALAAGPDRLGDSLDVLAILLGRLRNALADSPPLEGSAPIGVLFVCALHPLCWAPLQTLGQQSIMGAFASLCVPCLSDDAAAAMMKGLGARQGIRFADEALEFIVRQSQGVPLLLRRVGSSILELYDVNHARQGSLGAVNVGYEAAREAVEREEREGSPLRVWVESEIAEPSGPAGAMMRALAAADRVSATALRKYAEGEIVGQFASSGITRRLSPDEVERRAQEAASVMLRLLGETGLLRPIGDPLDPEAYELPDGAIRRVLAQSVAKLARRAS